MGVDVTSCGEAAGCWWRWLPLLCVACCASSCWVQPVDRSEQCWRSTVLSWWPFRRLGPIPRPTPDKTLSRSDSAGTSENRITLGRHLTLSLADFKTQTLRSPYPRAELTLLKRKERLMQAVEFDEAREVVTVDRLQRNLHKGSFP